MNEELTYWESKGLWLRKILGGCYIAFPIILLLVGLVFYIAAGNEDIILLMFGIAVILYCGPCCVCNLPIPLILVIHSLFIQCKTYTVLTQDGGSYQIVVFAGSFHHYVKVDGRKLDEHREWWPFSSTFMRCTTPNGDFVEVSISAWRYIKVKVNNQMVMAN